MHAGAAGSADRTVRLWSLDTGMPLATSRLHSGTVRALALDERILVSASNLVRPASGPKVIMCVCKARICLHRPVLVCQRREDLATRQVCLLLANLMHAGPFCCSIMHVSALYGGKHCDSCPCTHHCSNDECIPRPGWCVPGVASGGRGRQGTV